MKFPYKQYFRLVSVAPKSTASIYKSGYKIITLALTLLANCGLIFKL